MTSTLEGGAGSTTQPGRNSPPGKTRYRLYRRLGGLQVPSGEVRKISPPTGFDPRTVQPIGSRSIDYANRPVYYKCTHNKYSCKIPFILVRLSCNLNFLDRYSKKYRNIKFHVKSVQLKQNGSMRTDGLTKLISCFSQYCNRS